MLHTIKINRIQINTVLLRINPLGKRHMCKKKMKKKVKNNIFANKIVRYFVI